MKVFLLSPIAHQLLSDEQIEQLQSAGELVIINKIKPIQELPDLTSGDEDRILAIDPDFCQWKITNEDINKIPKLKAIVLQTTSFSYIDIAYCKEKGISVVNLRGFSSLAVAEWAIMAALNLARKIPLLIQDGWKLNFNKHKGYELRGKTAGIIGLGRIGRLVAENCMGIGMKVNYWSRQTRDDRFTFSEISDLMSSCDVIFLALPRNEETSVLLTEELLRSMKKSTIFVRTGFPPNHELLLRMIKDGDLYGYAFDEDESTFGECQGNVWASPPNAWLTNESTNSNAEQWVDAIVRAVNGDYTNAVNAL